MKRSAARSESTYGRGMYAAPHPAGVPGSIEEASLDPSRTSEILRRQHSQEDAATQDLDGSLESIESLEDDEHIRGPAELAKRQVLAKPGHILAAGDPPPVPQLVPGTVRQATLGALTANQAKLITLISHFGTCAASMSESESWLRSTSLLVLIYEGIQLGVFEFDFAPQSRLVNHSDISRRLYMNISQEGCGAIDDLLEWGLIRSLKMISRQHHLVTAYQITDEGRHYVAGVDEQHKVEVMRIAFGPKPYDKELVDVEFDGSSFMITTPSGYSKESDITDAEDVSYVTSPYIPASLRVPQSELLKSNKDRAEEATGGTSNKRGATLEELYLSAVQMLTASYVPINVNSLASLGELLGAHDACRIGHTLAAETNTDEMTSAASVRFKVGLSRARVLDWEAGSFLNLQTDVHFPESDGIVQIEEFGMHVSVDGLVLTGVKLEAILENRGIPPFLAPRSLLNSSVLISHRAQGRRPFFCFFCHAAAWPESLRPLVPLQHS